MSDYKELLKVNMDDWAGAFGFPKHSTLDRIVRWVGYLPASRVSKLIIQFNDAVRDEGLRQGSRVLLNAFTKDISVLGVEHIPQQGPVVIMSNHPGITDTVALFNHIPRPDLRTISMKRPFLEALPDVTPHLIFINPDRQDDFRALYEVIDHLKQGQAILTFPAGTIEPDPAFRDGAKASLASWHHVIQMFARLSMKPTIIPTLVSGVISHKAQKHPLTRLRKTPKDREWLGTILQFVIPAYHHVPVQIQFGAPIETAVIPKKKRATEVLTQFCDQMEAMIEQVEQSRK